jgi:SAM-dependent methyltransferase
MLGIVPMPLSDALTELRALLLDRDHLIRAIAAGHRRGVRPRWIRAQVRPVRLKGGDLLQVVTDDGTRPTTRNARSADEAAAAIDELLAEPFGNWHVQTRLGTVQLRVTKRGEAQVHREAPAQPEAPAGPPPLAQPEAPAGHPPPAQPQNVLLPVPGHDRVRQHLLDPGDPLFTVIGGSAAKRRQVDAFLRALDAALDGPLPDPLRVVDLGCGNAYLTFASYTYLTRHRGLAVQLTGVDVRADQVARNTALAEQLGFAGGLRFLASTITEATVDGVEVVLALHACDTATDEALARAVGWQARWILAAPCCHHDIAAQLRQRSAPPPYQALTRYPTLRERFADTLTDALRAALLRMHGYRVDVMEFIDSQHTPRNLLLRARLTGLPAAPAQAEEYDALVGAWQVTPRLSTLLGPPELARLDSPQSTAGPGRGGT